MCGGGPEIDIFGAPHSWSPLGQRTVTLPVGAGAHHYDRKWAWVYRFASGFRRIYASAIHTTLTLSFPSGYQRSTAEPPTIASVPSSKRTHALPLPS